MRLEHLLSRALVLAKCTPKKEDEKDEMVSRPKIILLLLLI